MSITRIIALSLALIFATAVGTTAFAPEVHAGKCVKNCKGGKPPSDTKWWRG